jgi:hypothetical protein
LPHTAARLFHLELRQASASHATASNFDKLTEAESAICLVGRLRVKPGHQNGDSITSSA